MAVTLLVILSAIVLTMAAALVVGLIRGRRVVVVSFGPARPDLTADELEALDAVTAMLNR